MARRGEDPSVAANLVGSALFPPMIPYAVGKFIGHGAQRDQMENASMAKKEAGIERASGIQRGLQLLTGSRARALEGQAASRGKVLARNAATGDKVFKETVFHDLGQRAIPMASAVGDAKASRLVHASEVGISGARKGGARASRAAAAERSEVGQMRKTVGEAALGVGAGAGAGALATHKSASAVQGLADTVAAGSKKIRAVTEAVQSKVVKNNTPLLTARQKLVGGAVGTGLGLGALAGHHEHKTAGLSAEREQQIKEAFGAAMLQGIKGIGQFAGVAGKSIAGAAKAGGAAAAGQAAMNAGRSGLMRAGNFVAKNPMAGAALVAAPALAAGYAAGRQ